MQNVSDLSEDEQHHQHHKLQIQQQQQQKQRGNSQKSSDCDFWVNGLSSSENESLKPFPLSAEGSNKSQHQQQHHHHHHQQQQQQTPNKSKKKSNNQRTREESGKRTQPGVNSQIQFMASPEQQHEEEE